MKGNELRSIRKHLGPTQIQLADKLGVAPNSVARWERDEMVISEPATRLARLLTKAATRKTAK